MITVLAAALSLSAQTGAAQAPREPAPTEITVEGVRNPDRQIGAFVDALTRTRIGGQLSRFDWAVCPAAVGLPEAQNAAVVDRMRKVAEAAGIRTAPAVCTPNALVVVTRSKAEMIEQLHRKYPSYFEGVAPGDIRRMTRSSSPAAAWQIEGRLDRDGVEVPRDALTGQYILEGTDTPSRLSPASRPHFVASVVVVEVQALAGLTPIQLADYAAMRAFARTDPQQLKKSTAPTILNILDAPMDSSVPITMTDWDLGFLKALYASNENSYANRQRGEIRSQLREGLRRNPGEE